MSDVPTSREFCSGDGEPCYIGSGTDDAHWRCGTGACGKETTNSAPNPTASPLAWRCDVPGCDEHAAIGVRGEQRCYRHALERGNEIRAERGLPPILFDDEGCVHVQQ